MLDRENRQRRLDRARRLARFEYAVAIAAVFVAPLADMAAPGLGVPYYSGSHAWWLQTFVLPAVGIGGPIIGLVWMRRIRTSGPEDGERTWRYRDT